MFHLDPETGGRDAAVRTFGVIDELIGPVLDEVTSLREQIEAHPADDIAEITRKAALFGPGRHLDRTPPPVADGVVAAALSTAGQGEDRYRDRLTGIGEEAAAHARGTATRSVEEELRKNIESWLRPAHGAHPSLPLAPRNFPKSCAPTASMRSWATHPSSAASGSAARSTWMCVNT